jgi:hypothetical protein
MVGVALVALATTAFLAGNWIVGTILLGIAIVL